MIVLGWKTYDLNWPQPRFNPAFILQKKIATKLSWKISLQRTVYCLVRSTSEFHNVLLALLGNFLENAGNRTFF